MIRVILVILTVLYPFGIYFGIQYFEPKVLSLLLFGILFAYFLSPTKKNLLEKWQKYTISVVIVILILLLQLLNNIIFMKLYPVLISLLFLAMFVYTLISPPSMVEKFARLTHKDLPPYVITYTRNVTVVWCCFLLINSMISLYTAFYASVAIWTLYNGFISYCLMGVLFVGEYTVRYFVIRKNQA